MLHTTFVNTPTQEVAIAENVASPAINSVSKKGGSWESFIRVELMREKVLLPLELLHASSHARTATH